MVQEEKASLEGTATLAFSSRSVSTSNSSSAAAPIELQIAQFIDQEKIDSAVAGHGLGPLLVVGGFGELVDQLGGQGVLDPVAVLGGRGAESDQ